MKLERETQNATGGRGPLETGKGRRWPGCPLQNTPSAPVAARRQGLFRQRIREPAICLGLGRCLSSVAAELCVPLMTSAFHAGSHFLSALVWRPFRRSTDYYTIFLRMGASFGRNFPGGGEVFHRPGKCCRARPQGVSKGDDAGGGPPLHAFVRILPSLSHYPGA